MGKKEELNGEGTGEKGKRLNEDEGGNRSSEAKEVRRQEGMRNH